MKQIMKITVRRKFKVFMPKCGTKIVCSGGLANLRN